MNFLAHFFLSHQTPELLIGSYLGDFVKGNQYRQYNEAVQQGILLHREVDRYTDHHPVFRKSKRRLGEQHGHYAGVIVDIFYDHLLAVRWSDYSSVPLAQFARRTYVTLQQHQHLMPPSAQRVFGYMHGHDWLTNYAYPEGIARTLSGMQQRARFPNQMGQALNDLKKNERAYSQEFQAFFPDVQQHVETFLNSTGTENQPQDN